MDKHEAARCSKGRTHPTMRLSHRTACRPPRPSLKIGVLYFNVCWHKIHGWYQNKDGV
jgi:hypothetical protein